MGNDVLESAKRQVGSEHAEMKKGCPKCNSKNVQWIDAYVRMIHDEKGVPAGEKLTYQCQSCGRVYSKEFRFPHNYGLLGIARDILGC